MSLVLIFSELENIPQAYMLGFFEGHEKGPSLVKGLSGMERVKVWYSWWKGDSIRRLSERGSQG